MFKLDSVSFDNVCSIRNTFLLDWLLLFQEAMADHSSFIDLVEMEFMIISLPNKYVVCALFPAF